MEQLERQYLVSGESEDQKSRLDIQVSPSSPRLVSGSTRANTKYILTFSRTPGANV